MFFQRGFAGFETAFFLMNFTPSEKRSASHERSERPTRAVSSKSSARVGLRRFVFFSRFVSLLGPFKIARHVNIYHIYNDIGRTAGKCTTNP